MSEVELISFPLRLANPFLRNSDRSGLMFAQELVTEHEATHTDHTVDTDVYQIYTSWGAWLRSTIDLLQISVIPTQDEVFILN
jgi:hypothetical protein